jgi:hypothetical protein
VCVGPRHEVADQGAEAEEEIRESRVEAQG